MIRKGNRLVSTGGSASKQRVLNNFSIDFLSEVDGIRYSGKFVSKKLSIRDIAALGVRKAQLNGGMHYDYAHPGHGVDEQTDEFNNMIAHLEISLLEAPTWWDLDAITDISLIGSVYKEVVVFENTFLGRPRVEGSDDGGTGEGGSSPPEGESGPGATAVALVDAEVSAALQP